MVINNNLKYTTTYSNGYSEDTEVFTDQGWKLFKELNETEKFLSLNLETEDLEFVKGVSYINCKSIKMINFKNRWNNLLVTPEHNMLVRNKAEYALHVKSARDVGIWDNIPRSSKWIGKEIKTVRINDLEIDAKTFCAFMGYWLSEGSVSKRGKNCYQIAIAQSGQEKRQKILEDISSLPLKISQGQYAFYLFNVSLGRYLQQFGKSSEKFVPDIIMELSSNLIKIFLDAYILGDGHIRKSRIQMGIKFNEERVYFTSSKKMADNIGELILKIGKTPSFKFENRKGMLVEFKNGIYEIKTDIWYIRETKSKHFSMRGKKMEEITYDGVIYCVELEKYHSLYVRRNGQCLWSGDCRK